MARDAVGETLSRLLCGSTVRRVRVAVTKAQPERTPVAVTESTARERTVGGEKNTSEEAKERGPSEESPSDWKAK
jgi:hypothetical protein